MIDTTPTPAPVPEAHKTSPRPRRATWAAALVGAFALGAGAAILLARPGNVALAAAIEPTPIAALQPSRIVAAKGDVVEVFGSKFILHDKTGRALVETGPDGGTGLVAKGEALEAEGRFEDGSLHAAVLVRADGKRVVLGSLEGPPGALERAKERLGLWPRPDLPALTALMQSAGYTDVRVTGRGPRHLEVVARGADGKDHDLHVDLDGRIRATEAF